MLDVAPTTADPAPADRAAAGYHRPLRWIAAALLVVGLFLIMQTLPLQHGIERLSSWIDSLGFAGMLVFAGIYVVAAVLLLPAWPFALAAGAIFGFVQGVVVASLASTLAAAVALLIGRYLARERVARFARQSPRFAAMDRAVSRGGWRIVLLLRLSPAIPFNLQNYFYGLTSINFWTCTLTSWIAMLPGTTLYVYIGYLGFESVQLAATADPAVRVGGFALLALGLVAIVALSIYLTRLAQRALRDEAEALPAAEPAAEPATLPDAAEARPGERPPALRTLATVVLAGAAVLVLAAGVFAQLNRDLVHQAVSGLLGPPQVALSEAWAELDGEATFDHGAFDRVLRAVVTDAGLVDYDALRDDPADLDAYLAQLADAPWPELDRDERLALLINAYNAFTLRLILDHWPVASIRDIDDPWGQRIWRIGDMTLSLDQIEHEMIRPNTIEPRIHWAVNCAAIGCPPLRPEAYVAGRLDAQLEAQARLVHTDGSRWFRFDRDAGRVHVTRLYQWYAGDFEQVADSVLDYAAQYHAPLRDALDAGERLRLDYLDYDWSLNRAPAPE